MIPWGLMLLVGAVTFGLRYSFFKAGDKGYKLPQWVDELLPLIPPAALAAMAAVGVGLYRGEPAPMQWLAALGAGWAMGYSRSFAVALIVGMLLLHLMEYWVSP